jgi:hypothetical protein
MFHIRTSLIVFVRFQHCFVCSADTEETLTASPRKTMLKRAKTFDLFASQDDGGEYIAVVVSITMGTGDMYAAHCSLLW